MTQCWKIGGEKTNGEKIGHRKTDHMMDSPKISYNIIQHEKEIYYFSVSHLTTIPQNNFFLCDFSSFVSHDKLKLSIFGETDI